MARARNIKPGFFKNEYLADLPMEARMLFIGLWTLADREGKLEDRPRKIKAELFPYDDCNIDELLNLLVDGTKEQFIVRYSVNGNDYIKILKFTKHQNPHCKEQASEIPEPCSNTNENDLHQINTVQALDKHSSCTADSLNLIPDSLVPSTDSLNDEKDNNNEQPAKSIYEAFSQNIHPITPMEYEALSEYVDDGLDEALVVWAIKQAVVHGKRSAKYITAILSNLQSNGIKTVEGAEARERDRKQLKLNNTGNGKARESPPLTEIEKASIEKLNQQLAALMNGGSP